MNTLVQELEEVLWKVSLWFSLTSGSIFPRRTIPTTAVNHPIPRLFFFFFNYFEIILHLQTSFKNGTEFLYIFALASSNVNILHNYGTFIGTKTLTLVQYWLSHRLYLDFTSFPIMSLFCSKIQFRISHCI